jgi:ADP-ribose pyrophosphatase YjhB (NUDIX family)
MTGVDIQVKAFAVLLNPSREAHLVWRGTDDTKVPLYFHRLLGGHVEFGEATIDAIRREIFEETEAELQDPRLLGVLENRFVYQHLPGHEIVFVYAGELDPPEPVPVAGGWLNDNDAPIWVEWRLLRGRPSAIPLYPDGVDRLIAKVADSGEI